MLDINSELENILVQNGIIRKIGLEPAIASVKHFTDNLADDDVIGIYGVGFDADTLLHFITKETEGVWIDYCFDQKAKEYHFMDMVKRTDVLTIDYIHQIQIDYMIIGSYAFRDELKAALREEGYAGTVIDLFEPMEQYLQEHTSDYKTIYEARKHYEDSRGAEQEIALRWLIKQYLLIKDFKSAFRYIDRYVEEGYRDAERYGNLKDELERLLIKIKAHIRARKQHDIVINWLDALSYMHLEDFPFLQSKAGKGINFEHAYAVNPWTTETMRTILYGEYPIESKLFLRDKFITDETKVLKVLEERGYVFSYLGMNKYVKFYDEKTIRMPELNFRKDNSSISRQWDALNLLCRENRPLCLMIHTLAETHEPYICGEIEPYQKFACTEADWSREDCQLQAKISSRYMDEQLEFYDDMIGEHITKIYMSDHGRITNSVMRESRVHTVFIVDYPGVVHETIKGIFSLIDFHRIIEGCLDGKPDFRRLEREYALVEAFDYYNISWIRMTLDNPKYEKLEALQRRGIITLKDRYCRFANGKECYFITGDDKNDRIQDAEYQDRVKELRELCGDEFIDIEKYDKFQYSRLLYEN